jgi:hypothetical protein
MSNRQERGAMTTEERYQRTFRFGSVEDRGVVGSLRLGQVAIIALTGICAIVVIDSSPTPAGIALTVATLAAGAAVAFVRWRGRTLEQWLFVATTWFLAKQAGDHRHRSPGPAAGSLTAFHKRRDAEAPRLPAVLADCRLLSVAVADGHCIGVIHDKITRAYTAALAIRVGAFGLLSASDQEQRLERWGRLLASLAVDGGPIRRIQLLERTVPSDADALTSYLADAAAPSIDARDPRMRSYESLVDAATAVTQDHELVVALQVDQRRAWSLAAQDSGLRARGRDEQACAIVVREVQALAARFDVSELRVDGILTPEALAHRIASAFDPYDPDGPGKATPVAADTAWEHYRADRAWHRTFWIREWPRLGVGAGFLGTLLLTSDAVRSVSIVFEPVAPARARGAVEAAITSDEADEQLRSERGFRTSARRRHQQDATLRREEELAEGHEELRFAGYVTASGRSEAELAAACQDIQSAAQRAYLNLEVLYGQQDLAFTQGALPLGRGLASARPLGLGA